MVEQIVSDKKQIKRIRLYVEGLDQEMEGGVPENHVVLICGTAGTMKSSLAFNILYNEVVNNNKIGLYICLEQSTNSLINHMINMGYDMSRANLFLINDFAELDERMNKAKLSKGALIIADLGTIRKEVKRTTTHPTGDWFNVLKNLVKKVKTNVGCNLFVLDSLNALYVLSSFENPRTELFYAFEFFRDCDLTTFLISETPLDGSKFGYYEVEDFLADGVIKLELVARQRKVTREISIVKMRKTSCNTDVFTLEVDRGRFRALYGGQTALI